METWTTIKDFPGYSVSTEGLVRNLKTGRILKPSSNQYDVLMVGLMRDGVQHKRSVPLLVLDAFTSKPSANFDTPINLNGHRTDNRLDNLVWRPRWYAVEYNRQFIDPYDHPITKPIRESDTGAIYPNSFSVATHFGLLEKDIVLSILNRTVVWITYMRFELVED
jgi:hypothetical protein